MKTIFSMIAFIAILGFSSCGPSSRVGVEVGAGYPSYYGPHPYYYPQPFYNPYYYRRYPSWGYPHYRGYYGHRW
jgi:hypothetical protein